MLAERYASEQKRSYWKLIARLARYMDHYE